jgi:hypothetical protein
VQTLQKSNGLVAIAATSPFLFVVVVQLSDGEVKTIAVHK